MADIIIDGGNAFSTYSAPSGVSPADLTSALFAPDYNTATTAQSYITPSEFVEAGTGVDVSQLVPAGSTGEQTAALARVIRQASSWADSLCYKTLAPTVDIQAGRWRVREGLIRIPLKRTPVIAVQWATLGRTPLPADLTPVTTISAGVIQPPGTLILPATYGYGCGWGAATGFYQVAYVNGYGACTTLSGSAAAGDLYLSLATNLGIAPGMTLTVDDAAATEQVTVSPSYVPGTTGPVPLAAACVNAHPAGAAVTAMPETIKRAVISLTSCLIKTRGSEAFVMQSMTSPPSKTELSESGGIEDFEVASDLLEPFRRVW